MAGIFGVTVFNDDIFNTTVVVGKVGGAYDGWLGQAAETVKPWNQRNLPEKQELELLVAASPRMGQLFSKDITSIPQIKQYKKKLYDIRLNPLMRERTDDVITIVTSGKCSQMNYNVGILDTFIIPQFRVRPKISAFFNKTLYGKKLHGVSMMRMAMTVLGSEDMKIVQ